MDSIFYANLIFFLIAKNIEAIYLGKAISVWYLVGQLLLLALVGFLAALVAKNYQGSASQFARNNLKRRFFAAFQGQGGDFGKETSVADVMTVASQGIDSLDTYFHHYLMTSLRTYLNCATILLLVVWIYPIGGVIFIACLPLIPISIISMQKRSKRIMNHYWGTYMDVGNLFMDDLKGMNTLYTYDADERYEKSFVQRAEEFRQSTMQLLYFQLQSVGYMDGVMYLGVGLSGFAAAVSLASGNLDILNMIFFVLIAAEFFAPIREMGYGMHLVMMNTKMADRIYTFLDSVEIESGKEIPSPITSQISTLTFEDVSFSYGKSQIFSAGELQRLELTRALLKKADCYIFDELTSNLDSLNEASLLQVIREQCNGYVFLLSHRESTLACSDLIYKVDDKTLKLI